MNKLKTNQNRLLLLGGLLLILTGVMLSFWGTTKEQDQEKQRVLKKYVGEDGCLVYGAHNNAPPLRFVDSDGEYKGVVVDYMAQLSLELGVRIKTEGYPWEEALQKLKQDETDFCDMFISEERKKDYVFSDPIYNLRAVLTVHEKSEFEFRDINKMRIATEKGDFANAYLKEHFPQAKLVYVKDMEAGMDTLESGDVDAVVGDEPIVLYYIQNRKKEFRIINTALYEEPVVLAMPKSHSDLVDVVNRAISEINKKGQLEKIQQQWFGISTPLKEVQSLTEYIRYIVFGAGTLLLLIGFFSYNNYLLKKKVKLRTSELEISRNELQLIFDSIPEYILIIGADNKILNANKELLKKAGGTIADYMGKTVEVLLAKIGMKQNDIHEHIEDRIIKAGQQVKAGKEIYDLQSFPVGEQSGGTETLITLRNITIDELNKKQLLQSSKMIAVGQLAAGMAHQIRNPLSVIRMQAFMLKNSQNLDAEDKNAITYIEDSVQAAGKTIDNVMNFWRVSDNEYGEINLYKFFSNLLLLQSNSIKQKEIQVAIACDKALDIISNKEALSHILMNLISNAIDAMAAQGQLRLGGRRESGRIIITCEDNGCGIAEEDVESLFNPFYTNKEPGKGTGLGLFIVYSEVEKLSGSIQVDSTVGAGTRFVVSLPDIEEKMDEKSV